MDSREDLPRVSVDSVQAWHRLKNNCRTAALASLEEHIAAHGLIGERDALVAHTNQFVERTFQMAQPNLRINGQNYESLDQDEQNTEPFDEALDRRIWSLADTRLQWQKRIAETRRTLPQEIATTILDLFDQHRITDGEEMGALGGDTTGGEDTEPEENDDALPRYSEVEQRFQKTLAIGEEMHQMVASQEERAERMRTVSGEVKALKF
ncbi:hypothetical protein LshimejAT787_0207860 [Lyophyllum shimeji]|uniref:Uncharacterized protein n=1 Tax=Lyophyllum shimeji TaxID=47721 RepID=A0A9P3PGT0_LYOSH|nr:hypothetical protein LshimejAT787_0207860 [Lyophyllum shimeji]